MTTILLTDTLLAVSCHHTRFIVCPAVSNTLRATLSISQSSPTYSWHLTRCRSRCQGPAHHPPHRHHTRHVLLAIVLAARLRPPFSSSTPCSPHLVIILVSSYVLLFLTHQGKKKLRPERSDARDALDVSDATCLTRTTLAMAPCVATHRATASGVRTQRPRHMLLDE